MAQIFSAVISFGVACRLRTQVEEALRIAGVNRIELQPMQMHSLGQYLFLNAHVANPHSLSTVRKAFDQIDADNDKAVRCVRFPADQLVPA